MLPPRKKGQHGKASYTDRPCRGQDGEMRRRWFPWPLEDEDREFALEILEEVPAPQGLSVWERFCILRSWCGKRSKPRKPRNPRKRGRETTDEPAESVNQKAITYFVGQVGRALGPGTLKTYLEHIKYWAKERGEPFLGDDYVTWHKYHRAASARYARLKDDAAVPLSIDAAQKVLKRVLKMSRTAGTALYLVAILGVRADTLSKSAGKKFLFTKTQARFRVSVGKQIRKPSDGYMVREAIESTGLKPPACLGEVVNEMGPNGCPFAAYPAQRLINLLSFLYPNKGITTYSFRKMFAERKIQEHGDAEKVGKQMGHKNTRIVGAHYLTVATPRELADIGGNSDEGEWSDEQE